MLGTSDSTKSQWPADLLTVYCHNHSEKLNSRIHQSALSPFVPSIMILQAEQLQTG